MKRGDATNIVLYDDQCPLCGAQTRMLRRLDWLHFFHFLEISDPRSSTLVPHLERDDLLAAIHCVTMDGNVFRAARCFRFLAMRIPLLMPLALLLWIPGVLRVSEKVYGRVARNRHSLSRFFRCRKVAGEIKPGYFSR